MVARTLEELLAEERKKVRLLERRLAAIGGGGGGGGTQITGGTSVLVTGTGTGADPYVIASEYGVFAESTIAHTTTPPSFRAGLTIGQSDASFPMGNTGVVEVAKTSNGRTIQRVTYKGDASTPSATYQRSAQGDGSTFGPWIQTAGDTGWQALTTAAGWSSSTLFYRVKDGRAEFRGEVWGGTDASTVFTMPTGARPLARLSYLAPRIVSSSVPPVLSINIQTSGIATAVVHSGGPVLTGSPGYSLGAMSYPVE